MTSSINKNKNMHIRIFRKNFLVLEFTKFGILDYHFGGANDRRNIEIFLDCMVHKRGLTDLAT